MGMAPAGAPSPTPRGNPVRRAAGMSRGGTADPPRDERGAMTRGPGKDTVVGVPTGAPAGAAAGGAGASTERRGTAGASGR